MDSQIIVRLSCIVWEAEAFLGVLNGMKGQIIKKKKKKNQQYEV